MLSACCAQPQFSAKGMSEVDGLIEGITTVDDFPKPGGNLTFSIKRALARLHCWLGSWMFVMGCVCTAVRFWDVTSLMLKPALFQLLMDILCRFVTRMCSRHPSEWPLLFDFRRVPKFLPHCVNSVQLL
jgi:hypothetical protein